MSTSGRDGAAVGALVGSIGGLVGLVTTEWWLLAAIPAGVAAGIASERWVVPGRPIALRTIATAAVLADALAAFEIVTVLEVARLVRGMAEPGENPVTWIVVNGMIALGFAGLLGLAMTAPAAWVGAWILRRLRTASVASRD